MDWKKNVEEGRAIRLKKKKNSLAMGSRFKTISPFWRVFFWREFFWQEFFGEKFFWRVFFGENFVDSIFWWKFFQKKFSQKSARYGVKIQKSIPIFTSIFLARIFFGENFYSRIFFCENFLRENFYSIWFEVAMKSFMSSLCDILRHSLCLTMSHPYFDLYTFTIIRCMLSSIFFASIFLVEFFPKKILAKIGWLA